MSDNINWGMITDGVTFQSLVAKLIYFQDAEARLFDRPGKDAGIDILSGNKQTVYQAKFRVDNSFEKICTIAKEELENIKKYKNDNGYERDCWTGVDRWIIVSNFTVNPNDNTKWDSISTEFKNEGIEADYWNLLKLESELNKFPVITAEYFSGKNRVFLSVIEAEAALKTEAQFAETLSIPYIGHSEEQKLFDDFLLSKETRVLPIIGEGGIGKTRFLIEIVQKAARNPIQVLWANVETMTCSNDWINAINPSAETLVIIDEPESVSLIRRVFEFIRADKWKAVIALRPAKQALLEEMRAFQRTYLEMPIVLSPLSKEEAKIFIESFLKNISIQITDPPQDVYIENLIQYTSGNPTWICIALNNIKKNPKNALVHNIDDIAKHYIDELITGMGDFCSKECIEKIFFYLALFRRVNVDDKAIRDFFHNAVALDDTQDIILILEKLKARRFLINYGYNKRFYAIKPDLIRDYILKNKLLSNSNPVRISRVGEKLIGDILNGKLPLGDEVLSSIARIDIQNNTDLLTKGLFSTISSLLDSEKTTHMQAKIVEIVKKIQFANIQSSVDIYSNIFETSYPPSSVKDKTWGDFHIDHSQVKRQVVWQLFCIAERLRGEDNQDIAQKIFHILYLMYICENSTEYLPNDGKNAKDLIPRILKNETQFQLFSQCAFNSLNDFIDRLDSSTFEELSLFRCIAYAFLSIEREGNYFAGNTLHITRYTLVKENLLLQREQQIIEVIKTKITSTLSVSSKKILIEIIDHVYHDRNRVRLQDGSSEQEECEITQWKIDLLKWVKNIVQTFSAEEYVLKNTMRGIWKWDLTYGNGELQSLARECESIFSQDKILPLIQQLCEWDNYKEHGRYAEELVELYSPKLNEIVETVNNTRKEHDNDPLQTMAPFIAKKYFQQPEVATQSLSFLSSYNESERKFGIAIVVNVLDILRNAYDSRYEQYWQDILNTLPHEYKHELFYALYSDGRPFRLVPFNDFDWQQLVKNQTVFPNKFQLFRCVAPLGFLNWQRAIAFLEEQWRTINDKKEQQNCLYHFKHNLHLYYLVKLDNTLQEQIEVSPVSFIFDHSGDLLDPSAIFDYDFEYVVQRCSKQPFSWFIDFLKKRMKMEQEIDRQRFPAFKVLPYEFSPSKWTDYSSATDDELYEFLSICEKPTFINFDLPRFVLELDQSGDKNIDIIYAKLDEYIQIKDMELIIKWEQLISRYPTETAIWRKCAKLICLHAQTLTNAEKDRLYGNLITKGIECFSSSPGEVPSIYFEKLHFAENKLAEETDIDIKNYWQYMKRVAEATIEWQRGFIEEEER